MNDLTAMAELSEAEMLYRFFGDAPESARKGFGITTARIGGGVVLSARHDPMDGFWNKSLGFGITSPVDAELIEEVIDFHRANGSVHARIQIAPPLLPPDWGDIVEAYGLKPGHSIVKLAGRIDDLRPGTTDLRTGPITEEMAYAWGMLGWELFEAPYEHLAAMMAASIRSGTFRGFAAWDGDEMAGVANLSVQGEVGHLNTGATRPDYRRRGIQSALIAARATAAAEAGCTWLVSETAPGPGNPSLNNVIRAGLKPLYERTEWIWN